MMQENEEKEAKMPKVTTPSGNTLEFDYSKKGIEEAKELASATGGDLDVQGYNAGGRVKVKKGYQMGGPVSPMGGQPRRPMGPGMGGPGGMPPKPMSPQGRGNLMAGIMGKGGPRPGGPGGMPGAPGGAPRPMGPGGRPMGPGGAPVSYTHLTLPTILRV